MLQPDEQARENQILQDMFEVFNHLVQKMNEINEFIDLVLQKNYFVL
jgi:hypothetical protein